MKKTMTWEWRLSMRRSTAIHSGNGRGFGSARLRFSRPGKRRKAPRTSKRIHGAIDDATARMTQRIESPTRRKLAHLSARLHLISEKAQRPLIQTRAYHRICAVVLSMNRPTVEAPLSARALAEVLNEANIRPEIMTMPTFVALTTDRWVVAWVPRHGWSASSRPLRQ
jgi:hypothetical protein